MPYNSGTGAYERRATTVIDATPDGDTVAVAIDVKLDQGIDDYVADLNHHKTNGNHYPATSTANDSRFLKQSPAGSVSWADGVPAPDAALKDFSNVASGAITPGKVAQDASNRFMTDDERAKVAIFPGRNKIINGNFNINQRGYVSGTNTSGANQYTLDRWRVVTSGQNITFAASGNGNLVTAPAGGIEQVIEGANIEGGTYVLNWSGTATATVNGTARTKGESFSLTANTDATVKFSGGTVGLVQLEAGGVATAFEHKFINDELARCERFLEKISSGIPYTVFGMGQAYSSTGAVGTISYKEKRVTPTFYFTGVGAIGLWGASTSVIPTTGVTLSATSTSSLTWSASVLSGLVQGDATALIGDSSGTTTIYISAEI